MKLGIAPVVIPLIYAGGLVASSLIGAIGGGGDEPPPPQQKDYTPYIIGGAFILGIVLIKTLKK
ncbi:MAG: hypothetical protein NW207_04765 [Cytophagales bacterium]|nr:hypothetical protein [Cytophagales bacterium]